MIEGQEYEPNIFLKIVIIAGGPAQLDTIALATYKYEIKIHIHTTDQWQKANGN